MSDQRQKNRLQMLLAFTDEGRSEAPKARREGTESLTANCETESPARAEQLIAKPISIKGTGGKSGGCAWKAVGLTSGDLLHVTES